MGRYTGNSCRLITMIFLTGCYFFVELIVGHLASSITLVADSFHMLSDVMALFVGLAAVRISRWPRSSKNSYGWQRAEVLGTLINTVMLVTLCFTIIVKAIQRFIEPEKINQPELMVGVGAGGLLINIIGLLMFSGHHHGHSHLVDESQHGHLIASSDSNDEDVENSDPEDMMMTIQQTEEPPTRSLGARHDGDTAPVRDIANESEKMLHKKSKGGQMNIKAVFLHVMADALGSMVVLISALVIWKVPGDPDTDAKWKLYFDPTLSLLLVLVILCSAIPLLKRSGLILLQSVPKEVKLREIKDKLETIEGINKVHDLHVWRLQSNCIIGTVHIRLLNLSDYTQVCRRAKKVFHDFNIHCTTIQPEITEEEDDEANTSGNNAPIIPVNGTNCVLDCGPQEQCASDLCCPMKRVPSSHTTNDSRPSPKIVRGPDRSDHTPDRREISQPDGDDEKAPSITTDLDV